MKRIATITLGLLALTACTKQDDTASKADFTAGNYTLLGRDPTNGNAYVGSMEISNLTGERIRMIETVKQRPQRVWQGSFCKAAPGEGWILVVESKQNRMACLVSSDLDNYARLTCKWADSQKTSGLMALFPQSQGG